MWRWFHLQCASVFLKSMFWAKTWWRHQANYPNWTRFFTNNSWISCGFFRSMMPNQIFVRLNSYFISCDVRMQISPHRESDENCSTEMLDANSHAGVAVATRTWHEKSVQNTWLLDIEKSFGKCLALIKPINAEEDHLPTWFHQKKMVKKSSLLGTTSCLTSPLGSQTRWVSSFFTTLSKVTPVSCNGGSPGGRWFPRRIRWTDFLGTKHFFHWELHLLPSQSPVECCL